MYMTYELSPAQIRKRIATAILGKGPQRLNGTWAEELEFAHLSRGKVAPPPGPVEIYNDASTWPEVEAKLERFKDQHGKYPDACCSTALTTWPSESRPTSATRACSTSSSTCATWRTKRTSLSGLPAVEQRVDREGSLIRS
jgi:hypothetical protein